MNARARELGATHSNFVNPNGLPMPDQYSTARDLSIIARAAYANPTIRSIVCLPQLVFRYANGRTRQLENTNKVLKRLPYCNGMKTGYTEAAGHCLIASGTIPGTRRHRCPPRRQQGGRLAGCIRVAFLGSPADVTRATGSA